MDVLHPEKKQYLGSLVAATDPSRLFCVDVAIDLQRRYRKTMDVCILTWKTLLNRRNFCQREVHHHTSWVPQGIFFSNDSQNF